MATADDFLNKLSPEQFETLIRNMDVAFDRMARGISTMGAQASSELDRVGARASEANDRFAEINKNLRDMKAGVFDGGVSKKIDEITRSLTRLKNEARAERAIARSWDAPTQSVKTYFSSVSKGFNEQRRMMDELSRAQRISAREMGQAMGAQFHYAKEGLGKLFSMRESMGGSRSFGAMAGSRIQSFNNSLPMGGIAGLVLWGLKSALDYENAPMLSGRRVAQQLASRGAGFGGGGVRGAAGNLRDIIGDQAFPLLEGTAGGFAGAGLGGRMLEKGFGGSSIGGGLIGDTYALARVQGMEGANLAGIMSQISIAGGGESLQKVGKVFRSLAVHLKDSIIGFPQFAQGLAQVASSMRYHMPDVAELAGAFLSLQRSMRRGYGFSNNEAGAQAASQLAQQGIQGFAGMMGGGGGLSQGRFFMTLRNAARRNIERTGSADPTLGAMAGGNPLALAGFKDEGMFGMGQKTKGFAQDFANALLDQGGLRELIESGQYSQASGLLSLQGLGGPGVARALGEFASGKGIKSFQKAMEEAMNNNPMDRLKSVLREVMSPFERLAQDFKRLVPNFFGAIINGIASIYLALRASMERPFSDAQNAYLGRADMASDAAGQNVGKFSGALKDMGSDVGNMFEAFSTTQEQGLNYQKQRGQRQALMRKLFSLFSTAGSYPEEEIHAMGRQLNNSLSYDEDKALFMEFQKMNKMGYNERVQAATALANNIIHQKKVGDKIVFTFEVNVPGQKGTN